MGINTRRGLRPLLPWLLALQLAGPSTTMGQPDQGGRPEPTDVPRQRPSDVLLHSLEPPALMELVAEVLERHPGVARALQRAAAAAARAPQVRALPDPVAELTLFALQPETRVGPQRLTVSIRQKFPWFGKLAFREQAALHAAVATETDIETLRLDVITEARRLFYELAFHHHHEAVIRAERDTLVRYEETARARYSAGIGLQQDVLKIQARITRLDIRFLEISEHRAHMIAALNDLRDRPSDTPIHDLALPDARDIDIDIEELRQSAAVRPELAAADARIAQRKALVQLAEKEFRPDFDVGLGFTSVGRRNDAQGRATPPEDDGDDIFYLTGSFNLPVRRGKLVAGLEEALANRRAAEEGRRGILSDIERSIGDLKARLQLLYDHWKLLEKVLRIQAREALRSAEAAYTTGKLNAVDLLDAEVVLLDVRTAAARTLTDYAVVRAQLERAVARPLLLQQGSTP